MSDCLGVKVRTGPTRLESADWHGDRAGRTGIGVRAGKTGSERDRRCYSRGSAAGNRRLPWLPVTSTDAAHRLPDHLEADADRALEILLDSALDPIVDMVLLSRDGAYEALTHDGATVFRRTGPGPDGYELVAVDRRRPARRPVDRQVRPARRRAGAQVPPPVRERLPVRVRHDRPALRPPGRPRSLRDPLRGAQLGGPGRPPRRARVARRRPGPGAVRDRGQGRPHTTGSSRGPAGSSTSPRRSRTCSACAPHDDDGTYLAGQDGEVRHDVLDLDAGRPQHVVGFLFDGTNPNVLYAMAARGEAPNVARLIAMGTAYEHGAMAGLPTVTLANHTSILTGRLPGHHGILNNAWFDRATGEQIITNSSATWPWAMKTVDARHRVDPHRGARAPGPTTFTASVQRAVRHRRRLLDVRLLPPGRGPADPEGPVRPARTPPSGSCGRRRTTVVLDRRPHGHRAGVRHLERPLPRRGLPARRASCG